MQKRRTKSYTSCLRVWVVSVLLKQYLAFLFDLLISPANRSCLLSQVLIVNRKKSYRTIQALINTSTGLYLKEQAVCPKLTLKYKFTSQRQNRKTCCASEHYFLRDTAVYNLQGQHSVTCKIVTCQIAGPQ